MSRTEYNLLSTKDWIDVPNMGAFFDIPARAFIDIKQRIAENRVWQIEKYRRDTLQNVETNLVTILDNAID